MFLPLRLKKERVSLIMLLVEVTRARVCEGVLPIVLASFVVSLMPIASPSG